MNHNVHTQTDVTVYPFLLYVSSTEARIRFQFVPLQLSFCLSTLIFCVFKLVL